MTLLEMNDIRKSFGGQAVLKGVNLRLEKGEVLSVIGPSGGGKSTLLRCATLLETVDAGSITYGESCAVSTQDGRAVYASGRELKAIRRRFGLVFQNFNLFPHWSVLKNVMDAPLNVSHMPRQEARDKAMALLEKMDLAQKVDAYPGQLSGGQQQRVSIARALAMDPEILFFDEPTSALDPELTGEVLRVIRSLAEEHMTMVVVTHEMAFASNVSDRVMFLDGGTVVEEGPPAQVLSAPAQERTRQFLKGYSSET